MYYNYMVKFIVVPPGTTHNFIKSSYFNEGEKSYDIRHFHGLVEHFPIEDHAVPTLTYSFCFVTCLLPYG